MLACPPIKPDHRLVQEHWGFYLWPNDEYSRHDLEAAADDTEAMEATLSTLVNATDIAASCDPGWGRILGAERYLVAAKVSREHRQGIGMPTIRRRATSQNTPFPESPKPCQDGGTQRMKLIHKKMSRDAGIPNEKVKAALEYLANSAPSTGNDSTITLGQASPGLSPNNLKTAQKKLLIELEWASRALVLSWVNRLTDISRAGGLRSLVCLRLAKIPSSHLTGICSADLWSGLPNVKEVYLGVLADWRRLTKTPGAGIIKDESLEPVEAVPLAFDLLETVAKQGNIKELDFEWICGGELSWGSQRGHFILPVPFTRHPEFMVQQETIHRLENILMLPYVKKLSLKNCWCSPHVFLYVMKKMARSSLEELKLESLSLSGAPKRPLPNTLPFISPLRRGIEAFASHSSSPIILAPDVVYAYEANISPNPVMPVAEFVAGVELPHHNPMTPDAPGPEPTPEFLTWSGIIDSLSSGPKLPRAGGGAVNTTARTLRRMEFKSCGYVAVQTSSIDTIAIGTWQFFASYYR